MLSTFNRPWLSMLAAHTQEIQLAIDKGIKGYFSHVRRGIPTFIQKHFRYPGCFKIHRLAFGWDLLRAPFNLAWAPFYVCLMLLANIARWCGFHRPSLWLKKIPGGLTTRTQKKVNALIENELFNRTLLKQCIIDQLQKQLEAKDYDIEDIEKQLGLILDEALNELMQARIATADITNTLISTATGAIMFKKFTPGGIGIGIILAAIWVKTQAVNNFFLGSTIGGFYYHLFPPEASLFTTSISVILVMLLLAVIASFSGIFTDPLFSLLGIHRRRLNKLVNQMEIDLLEKNNNRFKTLDPYLARILELFDTVKSQLPF